MKNQSIKNFAKHCFNYECTLARSICTFYGWGDSVRSYNSPNFVKKYSLKMAKMEITNKEKCIQHNEHMSPEHFCAGRTISVPTEV